MPRTPEEVAGDLYDEPRDLEPHEQEFLTAVHRITSTCARIKGMARREYGERSPLVETIVWTADQDRKRHLARALEKYEAARDALVPA